MSSSDDARKRILRRKKVEQAIEAAFDNELDTFRRIVEDPGKDQIDVPLMPDKEKEDSFIGEAACGNAVDVVEYLLSKPEVDPNHIGAQGRTPLVRACYNDAVEVVPMLLEAGADPRMLLPQERDPETNEIIFRPWDTEELRSLRCCAEIKSILEKWPLERTLCLLREKSAAKDAGASANAQQELDKQNELQGNATDLQEKLKDATEKYKEALARREERLRVYDDAKCRNEGTTEQLQLQASLIDESIAEVDRLKIVKDDLGLRVRKALAATRSHEVKMRGGMQFDIETTLDQLEDAALLDVGGDIKRSGKGCSLIIDTAGTGLTLLTYRNVLLVDIGNSHHMHSHQMTLNVLSCLRHGKPLLVDLRDRDVNEALDTFKGKANATALPTLFETIINRSITDPAVYGKLLTDEIAEENPSLSKKQFSPAFTERFACAFITRVEFPADDVLQRFFSVKLNA